MRGIPLVLAMVVMGVVFLISQVLILREFLLAFQGNEFVIGIVLGSWLLLEAAGSWLSGGRADRSRDPVGSFATVQALLSLLLPITLLLIRTNRAFLGASPWEVVSYLQIWAVSLVLLGPLGLFNGAAFTYGCRLMAAGDAAHAPGKVYALESLGAFLGGLAFTLLLVGRVESLEMAFSLGALSMGCVLFLFPFARGREEFASTCRPLQRGRTVPAVLCLLLMASFVFVLVTPLCGRLQRLSMELRWRPLSLEESRESIYGNIAVVGLGEQHVIYQNGIPSITVPDPDRTSLEVLVHLPLLAHPDPKEVLIMGGGVGGMMTEALKHPIRTLQYTELDPLLIRMAEKYATPSVRREMDDSRTQIHYEDGRSFLRRTRQKVDAVILNMPDPATLQLNRFFTKEFFLFVRRTLQPGGIFAFTMPGSSSYLSEEILRISRCVRDTLEEVFPHVRALPAERILFLASRDMPLESLLPDLLVERLTKRAVETSVVRPYSLALLMDPWQGRWLGDALEAAEGIRTNRDLTPALLTYTLAYKNAEVQPGLRPLFRRLESMRLVVLLLVLLGMTFPFAFWLRRRKGDRMPALSFAILSTGFCGMAVEMIVILSFQSIYGYIYQWIGLLIAAFMSGLACGAFLLTGMATRIRRGYRLFCGLEALQFGLVLAAAWGIAALHGSFVERTVMLQVPKGFLLLLNGLAGLLVGSEFPLASREASACSSSGGPVTGGRFYALDLAGAWLGTVMVSVLWVPLFGICHTLLFVACLKACSLFYLYRSR